MQRLLGKATHGPRPRCTATLLEAMQAQLPARRLPANNQFDLPGAIDRITGALDEL